MKKISILLFSTFVKCSPDNIYSQSVDSSFILDNCNTSTVSSHSTNRLTSDVFCENKNCNRRKSNNSPYQSNEQKTKSNSVNKNGAVIPFVTILIIASLLVHYLKDNNKNYQESISL